MGRLAVLWLRLSGAVTASRPHPGRACHHISDLESQPRPSALALSTAMKAESAARDLDLRDRRVLSHDLTPKEAAIEIAGPFSVGSPQGVFQFLDEQGRGGGFGFQVVGVAWAALMASSSSQRR